MSKEGFVKKLEDIVEGMKSSKMKIKAKNDEEKARRDALNNHLSSLIEQQRTYHRTIKKFTVACERNKKLSNFLQSVEFEWIFCTFKFILFPSFNKMILK